MKKTSKQRLSLARETVKALALELSGDQLRHVAGGAPINTEGNTCGSTLPRCGGCSSTNFTTIVAQ